jgi:nucleotide-binding universal stress UspA family protein
MAQALDRPLTLLHALEHEDLPMTGDLSGSIGLGAREDLLNELIELESQRAHLELKQGKLMLEAVAKRATEAGVSHVETLQRHGGLVETLDDLADRTRAVVIGRQGEAHAGFPEALGSHIESVIRAVKTPILVVAEQFQKPAEVMVAFDGSETAARVLSRMIESPLFHATSVHLVMVDTGDVNHVEAFEAARQQLENSGVSVQATRLTGAVTEALVGYQQAHQIDLTVMGAYGHSRIRQLFVGSQTTRMLQRSVTPVLFLR